MCYMGCPVGFYDLACKCTIKRTDLLFIPLNEKCNYLPIIYLMVDYHEPLITLETAQLKLRPQFAMPRKEKESPEEFLGSLHDTLATIFHGAQTSNASHKRRIKTLCQLHSEAAGHIQHKQGKRTHEESVVLLGEKLFTRAFWQITLCTLAVKRGVIEADRTIRFIGAFVGALMGTEGELGIHRTSRLYADLSN